MLVVCASQDPEASQGEAPYAKVRFQSRQCKGLLKKTAVFGATGDEPKTPRSPDKAMPLNLKAFITNHWILAIRKINDWKRKCKSAGSKVKPSTTTWTKVEPATASGNLLRRGLPVA
jgi:hypothetical protein